MATSSSYVAAALILVAVLLHRRNRRKSLPLPPGPKGLPFIGNLLDIPGPQEHQWLVYKKWSETYGSDLVSVSALGTTIIAVNSWTAAQDLFVKRASIYNDRPRMPMANELMGWDWDFAFMPYGSLWREHRKLFRQELVTPSPANQLHRPHALSAARHLVKQILSTPSEYVAHIRHMAGRVVLPTAYGIPIKEKYDPLVEISERGVGTVVEAMSTPYLVDFFPVLKHIPIWFPGAKFRRDAEEWAKDSLSMLNTPFELAKKNYLQGAGLPCIASRGLENVQGDLEKEQILKNVLAAMYAGGTDTIVTSLSNFILVMVLHQDAQRKAQQELDAAVGCHRLPELDDIESLPYLQAVLKETLRWHSPTPIGLPHAASEDGEYNGYFIPKGSILIGNAWLILRDESLFGPDTHLFKPERFLTKDGALNPSIIEPDMPFGFGRRICPGRLVANSVMMLCMAHLLHCFNMFKAKNPDGTEIEPAPEYTGGILSSPKPFPHWFEVRSEVIKQLIQESSQAANGEW